MSTNKIITIGIADDHKIFRDGIKMALHHMQGLKLIWEAEDGKELLKKIAKRQPDIVLLDLNMPKLTGLQVIPLLKKDFPGAKIIALSMHETPQMINKVIELGANAYLFKTTSPDEMYNTILACFKDGSSYNNNIDTIMAVHKFQTKGDEAQEPPVLPVIFNSNELKILKMLSEDKGTEEISHSIFLSPRTVENIRYNMKTKANTKTIGGLIMYGLRHRIIE